MKRVIWTRTASEDLIGIRVYFDEVAPELKDDQISRIILSARWLLDYPQAGSVVGVGRWRRWRARRTRYLLIYQPDALGIMVGHVRHDRSAWQLLPE